MDNYLKKTSIGSFLGNERENCYEFLGIRFADAERFEYATLIESYGENIDATKKSPATMQKRAWDEFAHLEQPERAFYNREFREGIDFEYEEGALYLNIFTPKTGENHPVIVFLHGGGFDSGSINESPYDGEALASRGNVVVFAQYRLGIFGYLTNEKIYEKNGRDGNFGLDDMYKALMWVRKNIGQFGGDDKNVTVMGQSAGAMSIQYMLCSDKADGLFDKAIMMSGAGLFPKLSLPRTCAETRTYWNEVIEIGGCKDFEEFRKLPPRKVFEAVEVQKGRRKDNLYNTMPVVDGYLIRESVDAMIDNARNLPLIIGITNNDMFTIIISHIAKKYSKKHGAYLYYFDIDAKGDNNKAFHSADLRYAFGTLKSSWRPYDETDYSASKKMMDYISDFALKGDPNSEGRTKWDKYNGKALCITEKGFKMGRTDIIKLLVNTLQLDPK